MLTADRQLVSLAVVTLAGRSTLLVMLAVLVAGARLHTCWVSWLIKELNGKLREWLWSQSRGPRTEGSIYGHYLVQLYEYCKCVQGPLS